MYVFFKTAFYTDINIDNLFIWLMKYFGLDF